MASPPRTHCAASDCKRRISYRIDGIGWCGMHGRRVRKYGSPDVVRRVASYAGRECSVDGCTAQPRRNGLCEMHSEHLRTHGDPVERRQGAKKKPGRPLTGTVRKDGYRSITRHGHPLADKWGHVLEHRVVLYEKIGPGEHPCHWCGVTVRWEAGRAAGITVDHVDFDPSNNTPANLVPACNACNVRRCLERRWKGHKAASIA